MQTEKSEHVILKIVLRCRWAVCIPICILSDLVEDRIHLKKSGGKGMPNHQICIHSKQLFT